MCRPYIRGRFLTASLVTLLAPLYKHQDRIQERLAHLITRSFPDKETEDLLRMVASERWRHVSILWAVKSGLQIFDNYWRVIYEKLVATY